LLTVPENGGSLGAQETQKVLNTLIDGLWESLFEIAREVDQLKADAGSIAGAVVGAGRARDRRACDRA
jgi:hypothetical protein